MPLAGMLDVTTPAEAAPRMESFAAAVVRLDQAEILQVMFEIDSATALDLIPPALHPTIPSTVVWIFWRCPASPWGPFELAQTRVGCRAGVRPRGYLLGALTDNAEAAVALAAGWGFRCDLGDVRLRHFHDRVTATASREGRTVLDVGLVDPEAISGGDVQYVAGMHLATTHKGVRLVQVDPEYTFHKAERGRPHLGSFDAEARGDARVSPVYPVSASYTVGDIDLPIVRYVCRPDVLALQGTEKVV